MLGQVQPNFGLDQLFGAHEKFVEFDPDLSEQLMFEVKGSKIYGRYFRQDYDLQGGNAAGQYSNGNTAAVESSFGRGGTLLIGSFPGAGYYLRHGAATRELFAGFLKLAGLTQQIAIDDPALQARLHRGAGGDRIWVTNPTREAKQVIVALAASAGDSNPRSTYGNTRITTTGRQFAMNVPARDAVVAMLR